MSVSFNKLIKTRCRSVNNLKLVVMNFHLYHNGCKSKFEEKKEAFCIVAFLLFSNSEQGAAVASRVTGKR